VVEVDLHAHGFSHLRVEGRNQQLLEEEDDDD